MKQKRKKLGRKLIGFLLTLAMVVGLMPGMGLTAYAETTEYDNYFVEVENLNKNCVSAGICSMTEGLYCKGLSADVAKAACNYLKSKTGSKVAVVYGFAVNTRKSIWSKIYIMVDGSPVTNYYGDAPIKSIIGDDCKLFYVKSDAPDFETVSATVTFKVLNGQWDDGTTEDVTVSLGGLKDTVYLASDQIPAVGASPSDTYKAGSWDTPPSTETAITKDTTYTYTYEKKEAAVVTKAPEARTLTNNGSEQELVAAGEAEGGEMQYTISKDATTAPVDGYKASLPTATDAGTYYVWYMVHGDENHIDSEPACVKVTIEEEKKDEKEETDDKGEVDEKEETDKKDETGTSIETEVNIADGAPAVKVDNLNNELAVKLLTDEEKAEYEGGTPVQVYLDVKALDKASVPAADLTAIEKKISDDGYTYGECLDLSLWKKVGDSTAVQIHDTNGNPISVTIPIPDTLKNVPAGYTRTFSIVRVHHGAMSVLGEGTGNSITIKTDEFSSYFIIFKDVKNATDDKKQDSPKVDAPKKDTAKAPATGDKINIGMIVMLMIDCVMAGVYLTLRRRMEK